MDPDTMSISDKGSYLLIEFFGEFSVETGKRCVDQMMEACLEHHRSRVLLDCRRMTGSMSVISRFQVAEYGAFSLDFLARFALVNRDDVLLPDKFVENVAINRGMDLKIFTDFDAAEQWLTE
jgi:hypothetical protein